MRVYKGKLLPRPSSWTLLSLIYRPFFLAVARDGDTAVPAAAVSLSVWLHLPGRQFGICLGSTSCLCPKLLRGSVVSSSSLCLFWAEWCQMYLLALKRESENLQEIRRFVRLQIFPVKLLLWTGIMLFFSTSFNMLILTCRLSLML